MNAVTRLKLEIANLEDNVAHLQRKIAEAIACHRVEKMRRVLKGALVRQELRRTVSP